MNRKEMINAIVEAAREPTPEIKRIIESNETTERSEQLGKGAHLTTMRPNPRVVGYAFANPQGHIYGRVEYDMVTLINRHHKEEDAEMSKLRAQLEQLNNAELTSQATLWLNQNKPSREPRERDDMRLRRMMESYQYEKEVKRYSLQSPHANFEGKAGHLPSMKQRAIPKDQEKKDCRSLQMMMRFRHLTFQFVIRI